MPGFNERGNHAKAAREADFSENPEGAAAEKNRERKKESLSERRKALAVELTSAEAEAEEARSALKEAEGFSAGLDPAAKSEMASIKEGAGAAFRRLETAKKRLSEIDAELRGPDAVEGMQESVVESMVTEAVIAQVIPNEVVRTVVETVVPFVKEDIEKITGEGQEGPGRRKKREAAERKRRREENE